MIQIERISKSFENIKALDSVCANIERGSIFGLIGSNGAGKSTLLRILAGIYRQDEGTVSIDGLSVFENMEVKKKIFYISDDQYTFLNDSMLEMAKYYQCIYEGFSMDTFDQLVKAFQLDGLRKMNTFSRGMLKRAHLIFALSSRTDYLLCDETFDGLDPVMRESVKRLLSFEAVERNMTTIIASHNLRELEDICDHVGLLHQGGILFSRDLEELRTNIHKIQCAFETQKKREDFAAFDLVSFEQRGRLCILTLRGDGEEIRKRIEQMKPLFLDVLTLSLEEIFISEMEGIGYDAQKIII